MTTERHETAPGSVAPVYGATWMEPFAHPERDWSDPSCGRYHPPPAEGRRTANAAALAAFAHTVPPTQGKPS